MREIDIGYDSDFKRAEEARRAGEFSLALNGYLKLLSRRLADFRGSEASTSLTAADAVVIDRAAELAILFGHDQGADHLFAGMASALESAGNFFSADYTHIKRVHLALNFGRLTDARKLLRAMQPRIGDVESISLTDTGFDAWESTCHWNDTDADDRAVIFSRLYLVLGWFLTSLGQYNDALTTLMRGMRLISNGAPDLAQRAAVHLRLTIATALLELGDLQGAREKLDELEPALDGKRQPGSYVRFLELSAKLKMLQGDFGSALVKYLEVLESCQIGNFTSAALAAMLNLSDALIFLNNTSVAQQILLLAKAQAMELNDRYVAARAEYLIALARARGASIGGDSVSAMRGAIAIQPPEQFSSQPFLGVSEAESFLTSFEDRSLEFYWYLNNRNPRMATLLSSHVRASFGRSDSRLIFARIKVLEGTAAYYSGDLESAERQLSESLPLLRQMGLKPELWQAQRILGWCWTRLGFPEMHRQQLTGENQDLLASMTASLPPGYQSIFLLNKWTEEEEFIAGEISRLVTLKERMNASNWFRKPLLRWSLMKCIHRLLQYVERHHESLANDAMNSSASSRKRNSSSFWKLIWSHPRDRATISFLVLPDRVLVVHAGWMNLDFDIAPISRIEIREAVRDWHVLVNSVSGQRSGKSPQVSHEDLIGVDYLDSLVTGTRNVIPLQSPTSHRPAEEANDIAEKLASKLLIPQIVQGLPRRVRALTIVPHDSLLGFPFAAIIHEGKFLLERFDINIDFGFFGRAPAEPSLNGRKALFVGVSARVGQFAPLPGVLKELNELEQWSIKRSLPHQTLINENATKQTIIRHLSDSALLHMACHGVFRADQPDATGLVLVPTNGQVEILSLRDLSRLDLSMLGHVTLSSCSSADNFILPGRLIIGLPETLRRAGVQSILASLWEVDDRVAVSFMKRFYEYLNHHSRDEALRRTQLDCLKRAHSGGKVRPLDNVEGIDTAEPFYWASYILCGDHRPLNLSHVKSAN